MSNTLIDNGDPDVLRQSVERESLALIYPRQPLNHDARIDAVEKREETGKQGRPI